MTHDEQIRYALERFDSEAGQNEILPAAQAWSRLQFRLAHQARSERSSSNTTILVAALYVVVFLLWTTWSALSAGLLAVLAAAAAFAAFFFVRISRSFPN